LLDVSRLSPRRCDVVFLAFDDMLMLTVRVALLFDAAAARLRCHACRLRRRVYAMMAPLLILMPPIMPLMPPPPHAAIYCCCRFAAILMPPPLMVSPPPLAWLTLTAAAARFAMPSDACRSHCLMPADAMLDAPYAPRHDLPLMPR
jgi:hypothetical protein